MTARILIAFYSRGGSVEALANAVAEGVTAAGGEPRLRRARELVGPDIMARVPGWADNAARMNDLYAAPTLEDADWADGILFGTPTRFGGASSELRAYIEGLGLLWLQNKLSDKPAAAFTSTGTPGSGTETTIQSLYPAMAHLGMIIVPNGYGSPVSRKAGTPYGSSSHSYGMEARKPTADELELARWQGERLTRIAAALKAVRA